MPNHTATVGIGRDAPPVPDPGERRKVTNLVKRYLNLVNAALAADAGTLVGRTLIRQIEQHLGTDDFVLDVDDGEGRCLASYVTRFSRASFRPPRPFEEVSEQPPRVTSIDVRCLREVDLASEDGPVESMLDWSWIAEVSRTGRNARVES